MTPSLHPIFQNILKWLAISLCFWITTASATNYIRQSAWLEDPTGQLALEQVEAKVDAFTPYAGVLAKGYTTSTFWIRLRIGSTPEDKLILRIRPTYIDQYRTIRPHQAGSSFTETP